MNVYEASNAITTVDKSRFSKAFLKALLNADETPKERQKQAQILVDYLCDKYSIQGTKVRVVTKSQPKRMRNGRLSIKILGTYAPGAKVITLYNLTAVTHKVVSIKSLALTLLHEFMHHYDIEYLKLGDTLHTAGFYKRITDLQTKLS